MKHCSAVTNPEAFAPHDLFDPIFTEGSFSQVSRALSDVNAQFSSYQDEDGADVIEVAAPWAGLTCESTFRFDPVIKRLADVQATFLIDDETKSSGFPLKLAEQISDYLSIPAYVLRGATGEVRRVVLNVGNISAAIEPMSASTVRLSVRYSVVQVADLLEGSALGLSSNASTLAREAGQ